MNYYNPYFYSFTPNMASSGGSLGLFGRLTNSVRDLNISNVISGTQKTLNIINQAIPIIKEASPLIRNAKTMFKIANEFKKEESIKIENKAENILDYSQKNIEKNPVNGPTFFL